MEEVRLQCELAPSTPTLCPLRGRGASWFSVFNALWVVGVSTRDWSV